MKIRITLLFIMILAIFILPSYISAQERSENSDEDVFPPTNLSTEVECDAISSFPYTENFDAAWVGTPKAPSCWSVINNDDDEYTWSKSSKFLILPEGNFAAHGMGSKDDYLISPKITLNSPLQISWVDQVEDSYLNTYDILLSTTNKDIASFTIKLGTINCTNENWEEHAINLNAYTGSDIYIAFHQTYSKSITYGFGIDDFKVSSLPENDIELSEVIGNYGAFATTATDVVKVVVRNNGTLPQTSISINYIFDNGSVVSETIASIAPNTSETFTFATTYDGTALGNHTLKVYTNLSTDEIRSNDTILKPFITNIITTIPSTFDFPDTIDLHFQLIQDKSSIIKINSEAGNTDNNGIFMTSSKDYYHFFSHADVEDAFTNTTQTAKVNMTIDATGSSNLFINFDFKLQSSNDSASWFRVLINDNIYAKTVTGDSVWIDNVDWSKISLNLNDFAGTVFSLSFQGALMYNESYKNLIGNKIYIDNINLDLPINNDIAITEIIRYYGGFDATTTDTVNVSVTNNGALTQTSIPINFKLDNGSVITQNIPSLAAFTTDTFEFTTTFDATEKGSHSLMVYTSLSTDQDNSNDTLTKEFFTFSTHTIPFTEDFETGYTYLSNDDKNISGFNLNTVLSHSGSQSVKNAYGSSINDVLHETGNIDLSASTNPVLDFWHIAKTEGDWDTAFVEISTDNGINWIALDTNLYLGETSNYDTNGFFHELSYPEWGKDEEIPDNTWWKMERFNLEPFKDDSVRVRFRLVSDDNTQRDGWYIDDITIQEEPAAIASLGNDTTICSGANLMLNSGSSVGYKYIWTMDGVTLKQTTNSININTAATYTVQINGLATVAYDTLIVNKLDVNLGSDTVICKNNSLILDAGNIGASYLWSNGETTQTIVLDDNGDGDVNYSVVVSIDNICTDSDTIMITYNDITPVNLGSDQKICVNKNITLDAGEGYRSYLWNTGATTQKITLNRNSLNIGNNLLKVEVYDDFLCSASDSLNVILDPCTGLKMSELTNVSINIFPNPNKGQFQIKVTGLENQDYKLDVYNSIGNAVYSKVSNNNSKQSWKLDFSAYPKGVYYIRILSKGDIKVKRIVIQ